MAMKKTSKTKRLPKFVAADYMLREHPFIIKLERMFRRMISNANDTRSKTLTNRDLTTYNNFLNKSTDAEIRETKKYLKWYKKTITSVPSGLSTDDKKRAKEIAQRNEKLCNELLSWIN